MSQSPRAMRHTTLPTAIYIRQVRIIFFRWTFADRSGQVNRTWVRDKNVPKTSTPPHFCRTLRQWTEQSIYYSWGLTSTATSYGWLRTAEGGRMGTTYSLHCHHQNNSALRGQLCEPFECFINCVGKVTRLSINHKFWRGRRTEADRTEVLLLTSLAPYR